MSYYFITLIVFQSYSSFCVSMAFSKEEAVKGLKEVTKMLEEGYEVDLNLGLPVGDTVVEQIQAVWSAVEQGPDLQLNKLSMKSIDLSIVSPKALEKVARKLQIWDISNAALSPTQCNAIFSALLINPDIKEINLSDNSLSSVLPENVAKAVQKSRSFLLANTSLTVHQVEANLTAVSSEASYLHTLDLSNNLLSVVEPQLLGDALMTSLGQK